MHKTRRINKEKMLYLIPLKLKKRHTKKKPQDTIFQKQAWVLSFHYRIWSCIAFRSGRGLCWEWIREVNATQRHGLWLVRTTWI